jgi:hypothetical protein
MKHEEYFSPSQINRRDRDPLMPKLTADLLPGISINLALEGIELVHLRPARFGRFPPRQRFIAPLRIPMPQSVHIGESRRFALPIIDLPLLDIGLVRRNQ